MNKLIMTYVDQMEQIHHGKGWIGVNFSTIIGGLPDPEFFHQPENAHSIAEIMSHLVTWRLESVLKIKTQKGSITDEDPSNWKSNKELQRVGKKSLLSEHRESVNSLTQLLRQKNDLFLDEFYYDNDFKKQCSYHFLVRGMIQHDLYHLGQISLLIRQVRSNKN